MAARPAEKHVREFLGGYVNDAVSLDEVQAEPREDAKYTTQGLRLSTVSSALRWRRQGLAPEDRDAE